MEEKNRVKIVLVRERRRNWLVGLVNIKIERGERCRFKVLGNYWCKKNIFILVDGENVLVYFRLIVIFLNGFNL